MGRSAVSVRRSNDSVSHAKEQARQGREGYHPGARTSKDRAYRRDQPPGRIPRRQRQPRDQRALADVDVRTPRHPEAGATGELYTPSPEQGRRPDSRKLDGTRIQGDRARTIGAGPGVDIRGEDQAEQTGGGPNGSERVPEDQRLSPGHGSPEDGLFSGAVFEQNDVTAEELARYLPPETVKEEIHLFCKGGYHATLVNGRYLRIPCKRSKCKHGETEDGAHVWDMWTGKRMRPARNEQPE
jgi:hypothetical protein